MSKKDLKDENREHLSPFIQNCSYIFTNMVGIMGFV
jgi:hypothetical protein